MSSPLTRVREPKASRARVWQAVEKIVHAGRRPTVEGVRALLGGGSPNSVTAYINEWYQELGTRLTSVESDTPGIPPEAIPLLAELWRLAGVARPGNEASTTDALRDVERTALAAQVKALETLNKELDRHRVTTEKAMAELRAMLGRSEAARDAGVARAADLEAALAQARLSLEIAIERNRLAGLSAATRRVAKPAARKPTSGRRSRRSKAAAKRRAVRGATKRKISSRTSKRTKRTRR